MTDAVATLRRIRELFDVVMDQPPEARREFLYAASVDDSAHVRAEVEALIEGELSTEALSPFRHDQSPHTLAGPIGQRLGAYEVVREIGDGGMGAVYEGIRADDEYRKRVAIKLVHRGFESRIALARFRRERQILANLEHRNIATLLDGGVSADGRPFIVMEYVDGTPITKWCDSHSATIETRLALFDQVCNAVQHAHRNLVVHLDLKPGNILVTDDGTVKLLDFGISRLIGDEGADAMPVTRGGPRAFTPEYASPEQMSGDVLTTAADVYSLGVVLFELLAGRRPNSNTKNLDDRPSTDRAISRPSTAVTSDAARRSGEKTVDKLRARLKGDLDSITSMAMRFEPERRYASVEALRLDVSRHLSGLPVRAQADTAAYRLKKFARRNVVGIGLSAAIALALIAGVISTALETRHARAEQVKAEELNGFLKSLLSSVQPATGGRDVPVSEVLDSAAHRIDRDKTIQPDVRAELETVIGQSYLSLARYDEAGRHFNSAASLYKETMGDTSEPLVIALTNIGGVYLARGDMDSAEISFNRALSMHKSIVNKPDTLLATLMGSLGSVAHGRGKPRDSELLHRQALNVYRNVLGPRDDHVATSMNNLAVALGEQDKWGEAETLHRQAIAIFKVNHAGLNTYVADAENALATALDIEGKNAAAESTYLAVLDMRKRLLGPKHPDYAFTLFNYSMFLSYQNRCKESIELSREVLALRGVGIPESHPSIASSLQTIGRCLDKLGRTDEGGRALQESYDLRRKYMGPESWLVANSEGILGEHETLVRRYDVAERMLLHSNGVLKTTLGMSNPRTQTNVKRLVSLYEAWNKPSQATAFRALLALEPKR